MTENELVQLITLVKSSHSLLSLSLPDSMPGEYSWDDVLERNLGFDALLMTQKTWRTTQNYFDDIVAACNSHVVCFVQFANHTIFTKSHKE